VFAGLILATIPVLIGLGAGYRQVAALKRVRTEPYMAAGDRTYYRRQAVRRLVMSGFLLVMGGMIFTYYLSGMDARLDDIPERKKCEPEPAPDEAQDRSDRAFTRLAMLYWIAIMLILGVVVGITVFDVWATRSFWMARYKEMKADHETKLQRDLAVYRQQKLNERAKGLKKLDDDTAEDPPIGD
jgi:hypothetical protein